MHNVMRKCNTSHACGVYVRMRLAALGQPGEFAHVNNAGPGPGGPRTPPAVGPMAARSPDPECTRPVVPNGNALMMRMRPFWVNGGPFPIKMLW